MAEALKAFLASMKPTDAAEFFREANPQGFIENRRKGKREFILPDAPIAKAKAMATILKDQVSRANRILRGNPDSRKPRKPIAQQIEEAEAILARKRELQEWAEKMSSDGPTDLLLYQDYITAHDMGSPRKYPTSVAITLEMLNRKSVAELEHAEQEAADSEV